MEIWASWSVRWRVTGSSRRGASHVRANKPNQDSIDWRVDGEDDDPAVALAISDGHGSSRCFRSDRGSKYAVQVAAAELLLGARRLQGDIRSASLEQRSVLRRLARESIPRVLTREWRARVDEDLAHNPITSDELGMLETQDGPHAVEQVQQHPRMAYGATLLAVVAAAEFIIYVQLGDGEIVVVEEKGIVRQPLPRDPRLLANETTSLSSEQPWADMLTEVEMVDRNPPALLLVSTDGYANSFASPEGFLQAGSDILECLRTDGADAVDANLPLWLDEASDRGSGDDVTVGLLYRAETCAPRMKEGQP